MAGLRPYEDFGWFDAQGPAVGAADIITQDRMNQEKASQPSRQTEWNSPVAGVEGGALSQSFGNYRMTPGSPSVSESQHWDYYQPEMQGDDEMAPPPVDPMENPGGALAASTSVRAYNGGGSGAVRPMPVPKPGMVAQEAQEQRGKQTMFDMNKIPAWQDSKAFNQGLLSFGLNLLSGNDWATSFNQAGNHFNQAYGREKRELWAQDLVEQGYDAHEIQSWVDSGDHKALSDPMQKKMQQQQYALGQQQLNNAMYENSDEMREWKAQREYTKDLQSARGLELQEMSTMATIQNQRANQEIARATLDMKKQAAAAKAGEDNEKFSAEKHKNTMYYLRGNQGLKNYNDMLQSSGGQTYNQQTLTSDFADAATIEGMFSGNQFMETAARRANPRLAEMIGAERAFLAPILRVESGAAISNMEWKTTGEQFFPRPGDSPQRIDQKSQLRELAVVAQNPNASKELKQTMEMYSTGALPGFRLVNGQAYASEDGKSWYKVPMHK
ncbi:MAG: hypothetical protein ACRC6V_10020 [Bacteroidales bacterium]